MRLFERGEVSFIFLWVLNPIVILFYQNCTPTHLDTEKFDEGAVMQSRLEKPATPRTPASHSLVSQP